MKFNVLALDYDGTIADHGRLNPAVALAIRDARKRGIKVILNTGRILSDLRKVMHEDDLFDAIVSENGAVLSFPNGWTRVLGRPASREVLSEFCNEGIKIAFGDCIVEADASASQKMTQIIRRLQLPLMLVYNHGRVMVLPQGITKASGLHTALDTMRLSVHNCIGIGDGENDHSLLDACEIGVAVSWGSKALQNMADHVLEGDGPEALADYIREVSRARYLPPQRARDRRMLLGRIAATPVKTSILGRSILVTGDPKTGKSWIGGLLAEHLILHGYCLCVIDPEGEYSSLELLPDVVVFNDAEPPRLSDVRRALQHPDTSIVIDLSSLSHEKKQAYNRELLPMLEKLRQESGLPHWIVLDEAHYFLNQSVPETATDFQLGAYVLITYRPSQLHPDYLSAKGTVLTTTLTHPDEVATLVRLRGSEAREEDWIQLLGSLNIHEAAIIHRSDTTDQLPQRFTLAPRLTNHVRHRSKYIDVPMSPRRAFHFTCNGQNFGSPARSLKEFVNLLVRVPVSSIHQHARQGDFSRWIAGVLGDQALASSIHDLEKQFQKGKITGLTEALNKAIIERYDLPEQVPATVND